MLSMLDRTDIAGRRPTDPQAWFLFAQASRLIYADRDRYVADPRFVPVPVERLLDPAYVRLRVQLIANMPARRRRRRRLHARGRDATAESAGTSHFVIVDADGNAVSMTTTVESIFGSDARCVGSSSTINSPTSPSYPPMRGARSPMRCRAASVRAPRWRRSSSSIAPATSSPPSALRRLRDSRIQCQGAGRITRLEAVPQQAIELPNLIARGDTFSGEIAKFSPALLAGLRERGIELKSGHAENSGLHAVVRLADGSYEGAADSRREGVARMLPAHAGAKHAGAK